VSTLARQICVICLQPYTPRGFGQSVCSPRCGGELARQRRDQEQETKYATRGCRRPKKILVRTPADKARSPKHHVHREK
jgi:hypothetical protein